MSLEDIRKKYGLDDSGKRIDPLESIQKEYGLTPEGKRPTISQQAEGTWLEGADFGRLPSGLKVGSITPAAGVELDASIGPKDSTFAGAITANKKGVKTVGDVLASPTVDISQLFKPKTTPALVLHNPSILPDISRPISERQEEYNMGKLREASEGLRNSWTIPGIRNEQGKIPYTGAGNIDLNARPTLRNEDGSFSTIDSFSAYDERKGKEVLLPTVIKVGGEWKHVSEDEAWAHYERTGEHLGYFDTPEEANEYAQRLHVEQAKQYGPKLGPTAEGANAIEAKALLRQFEIAKDKSKAEGEVHGALTPATTTGDAEMDAYLKTIEGNAKAAVIRNYGDSQFKTDANYTAERGAAAITKAVENTIDYIANLGNAWLRTQQAQNANDLVAFGAMTGNEELVETAVKQLEAAQKTQMQDVANFGTRFTQQVENKYAGRVSDAGKIAGNISSMIGYMVPSIVTSMLTAGLGASAQVASNAARIMMASSVAGGAAEEAKAAGASDDRALIRGTASGIMAYIVEGLAGGIKWFGKGTLDDGAQRLITKILKNESAQYTALKLYSFLGEGVEEFIEEVVGRLTTELTVDLGTDTNMDNRGVLETLGDGAESFLYGVIVSGILQMGGNVVTPEQFSDPKGLAGEVAQYVQEQVEQYTTLSALAKKTGGETQAMVELLFKAKDFDQNSESWKLGNDLWNALYARIEETAKDASKASTVRSFWQENKHLFEKLTETMAAEKEQYKDPDATNETLFKQAQDGAHVMTEAEGQILSALQAKGMTSHEAAEVSEYVSRIVAGDTTLSNNDLVNRAKIDDSRVLSVINEMTGSSINVKEKSKSELKRQVRAVIDGINQAKTQTAEAIKTSAAETSAVADVEQMVAETRASIPLEQVFTPAQQASPAAAPTVEPTAAEQSGADKFMAFAKGEAEAEIQPQSEYTEDWLEDEDIKQVLREQGVTDDEARALLRNYEAGARAAGVDPVADFSSFIRYSVDEQVENYVNVGNITDEQKLARDILKASLADLGIKDVVLVTGDARMVGSNGSYVGGVVTINADRINTQTYSGIAWTVGHEIVHAAEDADGGRKANGVTVRNAKIVNDIFDVMRVLADAGAIEGRYAEITRDEKSLAALIDKKKNVEHRFLMRDWVDENGVFHKGMTKQEAERSFNDFDARAEIAADFLGSMLGHNFKHEREGRFGSKFGTSDIFAMMEETAPETTSWIQEKLNSIRDRLRGYDAKTAAERKAKATMQHHLTKLSKELAEAISKGAQKNAAQTSDVRNSVWEDSWEQQCDDVMSGKMNSHSAMFITETPNLLAELGLYDLPMSFTQKHFRAAVNGTNPAHPDKISLATMKRLPQLLSQPVAILSSNTNPMGAILVVTTERDSGNNPIVAAILPEGGAEVDAHRGATNHILTVYGANHLHTPTTNGGVSTLERAAANGDVLYINKKRSQDLYRADGLQLPRALGSLNFDTIIRDWNGYVKKNPPAREAKNIFTGKTIQWSVDDGEYAAPMYSKLQREIEAFKGDRIGASSAVSYLRGKGVKAEEIKWSGIETYLEGKKSVNKQELLDWLKANELTLTATVLGGENNDYYHLRIPAMNPETGEVIADWADFENQAYELAEMQGYDWNDVRFDEYEGLWQAYINDPETGLIIDLMEINADAHNDTTGETHWEDYTTGKADNYREILWKMPESSYSNQAMRTHWGDEEGVVVHARIDDQRLTNGSKALFIEEIQSDWHNEGHKQGYSDAANLDELKTEVALKKMAISDAYVAMSSVEGKYTALLQDFDRITNDNEAWQRDVASLIKKLKDAEDAHARARHDHFIAAEKLRTAVSNGYVPDAPFRYNYHEYALKNLLRMAAEEEYDALAWTPAYMQSERWSDEYAEGYRIEYDQDIPKFLNKYGKQWGAKVERIGLDGVDTGIVDEAYIDSLTERNYEIIRKLRTIQNEAEAAQLMSEAQKLQEEIRKARLGTVWAIPITPEMKRSVLYEGQQRFSVDDSDGNTLSAEQQEYFKDSKVRDENGRLKVMYHGSRDAGFHIFDPDMSDDGISLFFTDRNDVAASYSDTSKTYEARKIRTAEDFNKYLAAIGVDGYKVRERNGVFSLYAEDGFEEAVSDSADGLFDMLTEWSDTQIHEANYKVYLNLTNPLEVDAQGREWNSLPSIKEPSAQYEYIKVVEARNDSGAVTIEYAMNGKTITETVDLFEKFPEDIAAALSDMAPGEVLGNEWTNLSTTRDYAHYAKENGYDGIIFKDIVDIGGYGSNYHQSSTVAIAFSSEQIKSVANLNPTADKDIRYSVDDTLDKTAESEYSTISNSEEAKYGNQESTDNRGRQDLGRADNQPHRDGSGESSESGGRNGRGNLGRIERTVIPEKTRKILDDKGIPNVELEETTDRDAFSVALENAKAANPNGGMVDSQSPEDMQKNGSRTFMRADGNAGVAVERDGNIVGVFKNPEYKERGAVYDLILTAVANEGNHLDCYSTYTPADLRTKYARMGFEPVCYLEFNREYAPDGWNYEAWGEPDVVLWVHNGDTVEQIVERTEHYHVPTREEIHALPKFEDYDEAKAYQTQKVEEMLQSKARAETLSKLFRYSVDDTIEAPVKETEAPTEPELTPQQIRGRDRAEAIRRVFTAAREMYGDDFVKKMSEDTNTKAGIERLNQVFRPAADQARAEQRTRDDLRLQREREREAKRRREMRKAFNLEKQDIRKEEREKARIDKMAALAVQEQKLDDKWKARMEANVDKVKAQAEERLRIKMRKADFIRAYENLAAEIREKKAKAEGKRRAAEERRRGNERISEQRVLSRTTAKEARRVLSQSRNTDRPDYTNSEVETLRQLRPDDVSTEQVTTLADKLRNARKRLYRVFVNQAQTIDNFSKLQIDGIRAGSLVNMIFGSASTIETIYQNGLVARDGTRLGDAMKEVFLVRNADGSIDQEKQAILQDYMLFVHNIDRMSFSERALARVEAMEAQHPWLVDIGAKEFAYAAGLNDAETEATGTDERRAIVREYAAALKALNEAKDKPIFADKDGKPVSAETSREIVARYEEEHPWLKEKAEGIYEWWDSFMREWAVGNTLSAEAYDTWKQMYPHYVPTYRMNEGGPDGAIQIGPVSASINDLYKAAKGSTKPVKNIEESFSTLVRKIVDTSRKNELLRNIIDTAMLDTEGVFGDFAIFDWDGYYESNPEFGEAMENAAWLNGDSISAVESAHVEAIEELDGGYRITAYGMDGGRFSAWVSKEMYRALVAVTNTSKLLGEGVNTLTRIGSKLTTPMKGMITGYNPNFAIRNVMRDIPTAIVNGISGFAFPKYAARAFMQMKNNSETWQQFKALGGTHFGYYGMSTDWAARMEKKPGLGAKALDKLGTLGEYTESITRFAEYLATIDKLGDTYEGRVQGIKNAAEVTVDFSRKGEYGKLANAWIPYWNPAVQGIDKLFRQIFDNSTSVKQKFAVSGVTLTRGAIVAVLPELLQYLLLKAADRYDDWEKLSDRMKDSYFCIPIAGEHKFFKIPKTREWGTLLGTPLMRMLESFNGRSDPFENYVEDALLANFSVSGVVDAIGISTIIDLRTNKDFAGRDIVPYAYQDAPASLQYDADTSAIAYGVATAWNKSFAKIAEALGKEVELSPMQLDYILNDYCGDFYYMLAQMAPVGLFDGSTSVKEIFSGILGSMEGTWVGDNRYSNYYTGEYYDILDYLDRNIAGEKLMNPEDYTNSYVFKLDKAFNEAYGKQLSELNKQATQLPDGEEKDAIKEQIADLALEAVEWFRNETINNSDDPFLRVSYGDFSDELQDALIDLDGFSGDYYFKPSPSTSKSYTDPHNKGKEYVLTEEQYAQYKTFYMEAYDEIMTQAVKSYQYKRLSDEEKAEYLDEARDAVHEKAKEELFTWLRRNGVKSTYKAD